MSDELTPEEQAHKLEEITLKLWMPQSKELAELLQWYDTEFTKLALHYHFNEQRKPYYETLEAQNEALKKRVEELEKDGNAWNGAIDACKRLVLNAEKYPGYMWSLEEFESLKRPSANQEGSKNKPVEQEVD